MAPPTVTIAPAADLPAGAVALLTRALASTRPRLRWVCRLRAVHAAWLLRAQRRAHELGPGRCWGRGLVAVAPAQHGRSIGTALTRGLVATLPEGDRWLPVALTERTAPVPPVPRAVPTPGLAGAA